MCTSESSDVGITFISISLRGKYSLAQSEALKLQMLEYLYFNFPEGEILASPG
jgi:hypothetical protein